MQMTPARAHFLRSTAASASTSNHSNTRHATAYELMLIKLAEDRRRLKQVQSLERKAEIKKELLPDYQPWIDGVLQSDSGHQDDVLMTVMVWHIDAGNHKTALKIAGYALKHGLTLPDQYQRTTGTLIAEEIADTTRRAREAGHTVDISIIEQTIQLTAEQDMPDEVRSKLHKELGLQQLEQNPNAALSNLKRATQLNDKAGVKKEIERLERTLKNTQIE